MPPTEKTRTAEAKHTPTPWRKHDMEADAIVGPDRKAIALVMGRSRTTEEDDANMEFILTAVNQHAALQASNEEMAKHLKRVTEELAELIKGEQDDKSVGITGWNALHESVEAARSALTRSSLNTEDAK